VPVQLSLLLLVGQLYRVEQDDLGLVADGGGCGRNLTGI
jgi:hypothetical protein